MRLVHSASMRILNLPIPLHAAFCCGVLFVCTLQAGAQAQPELPRPARPVARPRKVVAIDPAAAARSQALKSPVVNADRSVTFKFQNSDAKAVAVFVEGNAEPFPMERDANGLWTYTTEPMSPEYYGYYFVVDEQHILDPHNPKVRQNLQAPSSFVHVTGATPMPWDLQDIPHGNVTHHMYTSKLATDEEGLHDRDMYVYTPVGYDAKRKQPYPVLYLLHGYSDSAIGWTEVGDANLIFDQLIASGKLQPTVIVMPRAYGTMRMITEGWTVWTPPYATPLANQRILTDMLLHEILPYAEANFNVARDPGHRAIAGLSMGGGETISTGLNHPETFGYVGAMSSAIVSATPTPRNPAEVTPEMYATAFQGIVPNAKTQPATKLFWISCGTEDGLITVNRAFGAWAKQNIKGNVSVNETPGMHTWLVWRQNLITFSQLMFK